MTEPEIYWKRRHDELASKIRALHEETNEFKQRRQVTRVWEEADYIYVSFDMETCDSEDLAKREFGEGLYDIYRLWKSGDGKQPKAAP